MRPLNDRESNWRKHGQNWYCSHPETGQKRYVSKARRRGFKKDLYKELERL